MAKNNNIKLDIESFNNILKMLNSSDKESNVMGLVTIENLDFKKNLTIILLLKKLSQLQFNIWKINAPKTYKKIDNIIKLEDASNSAEGVITYKTLLKILVNEKQTQDDIQLFLDIFASHIFKTIQGLGFDFIDDTEITIKLKTNDKQNRISCQDLQESNV